MFLRNFFAGTFFADREKIRKNVKKENLKNLVPYSLRLVCSENLLHLKLI